MRTHILDISMRQGRGSPLAQRLLPSLVTRSRAAGLVLQSCLCPVRRPSAASKRSTVGRAPMTGQTPSHLLLLLLLQRAC